MIMEEKVTTACEYCKYVDPAIALIVTMIIITFSFNIGLPLIIKAIDKIGYWVWYIILKRNKNKKVNKNNGV